MDGRRITHKPRVWRPLQWLNAHPMFRRRGIRIVKVVKVGRLRGEFDLILDDETRLTIGTAAHLLNYTTVQSAFVDHGFTLPEMEQRRWLPYVECIVRAAEIQDEVPRAA